MQREFIYDVLMSDNVLLNINNNLEEILKIIPEIKDMIGFEHNHPHHHLDVWNHTLLALSYSEIDFELRLVLLLHDIGKPHSYQDDEVRRFIGHPRKSSKIANDILKRLEFEDNEISRICYLIEQHDSPITDNEITYNKEFAVKRFKVQCCDALAHNPLKLEKRIKYLYLIIDKLYSDDQNEKCKEMISRVLSR